MRRILLHFLFLWLRAHWLTFLPVCYAEFGVELLCGNFSRFEEAREVDNEQFGGITVHLRHPEMTGEIAELVPGMHYEAIFSSNIGIPEVQGVAMFTSTEGKGIFKDDYSWTQQNNACPLHLSSPASQPTTPSALLSTSDVTPLSTSSVLSASQSSETFSFSDQASVLLESTGNVQFSSTSSSLSPDSESLTSKSETFTSGFTSSHVSDVTSLHTSLLSSSSSSSLLSTTSSFTEVTPNLEKSPAGVPTEPSTIESSPPLTLPLILTWVAGDVADRCIVLTFVIRINASVWVQRTQEICKPAGCKQYFTAETGILKSPFYPSPYPDDSRCTFIIVTPPSTTIELQFQVFDLEHPYSGKCVDWVTVSNSTANNASAQLCGSYNVTQLRDLHYVSSANTMVVRFDSDNKVHGRGFKAVYSTRRVKECDTILTNLNGTITSPRYPATGTYLPNMRCRTVISLPSSYRVRFYPIRFNLTDLETGACSEGDVLRFQDLESYNEASFSCTDDATKLRPMFESSESKVEVVFSSDHVQQGAGFEISYIGVPSCKNETFHVRSGSVASVNHPKHYPNMQECFYTINVADQDDVIELTFQKFMTESDSDKDARLRDRSCTRDFVEIYDGRERHKVCGDWSGKEHLLLFRSKANVLVFRFVSDEQETRPGFYATWQTVKGHNRSCLSTWIDTGLLCFQVLYHPQSWEDSEADCISRGGHLATILDSATQGLLNDRILSQECTDAEAFWIGANDREWESDFYWPDGRKVSFTNWFPGFPLSGLRGQVYGRQPSDDGQAEEDCVEMRHVFSRPEKGQKVMTSFFWNDRSCGQRNSYICQTKPTMAPPEPVKCDRNISLTPDHPWVEIHSPGYPESYPDHTNCTYFIHAPPASKIEIEFYDFHLENGSDTGCEYDFLQISTSDSPGLTDRMCGDWSRKAKLLRQVVMSFYVFLHFQADHSKVFKGFNLTARITKGGCENSSWIETDNGCLHVISDYPDGRRPEARCAQLSASLWEPETIKELPVAITRHLSRNEHVNASGFRVVIRDGNEAINGGTSCQVAEVAETIVTDNVTIVTRVTLSQTDCNAQLPFVCFKPHLDNVTRTSHILYINFTSGHLRPRLDSNNHLTYTNNDAATWVLEAPPQHRLLLVVEDVDLEFQDQCLYDWLFLANTTQGERICGVHDGALAALSWDNTAQVTFHSDYSITGRAFTLTWRALNMTECHTKVLEGPSGNLSSFSFPLPFPDTMDCLTEIVVSKNSRVVLVLEEIIFHRQANKSVTLDLGEGVTLRLGGLESGSLLDRRFVSYGNVMKVRLSRDFILAGEGFYGYYEEVPVPCKLDTQKAALRPQPSNTNATTTTAAPIGNNDHINTSTAALLSPNYPARYPSEISQETIIRAPIGYRIHVTFHHFRLRDGTGCSDVLSIDDVSLGEDDVKVVPVTQLCGGEGSGGVVNDTSSYLNVLRVRFTTGGERTTMGVRGKRAATPTDEDADAVGFNVSFTAVPDPDYLSKTANLTEGTFDSCDERPCLNNSSCLHTQDGRARCACHPSLTGLFCQMTWCDLDPCESHGRCDLLEKEPGFQCTCNTGYFGLTCRMDTFLCRKEVCNGRGACVGNSSSPQCLCDESDTGEFCNIAKESPNTLGGIGERLLREPILIGLIVILSVLFLFGILCIVRRRCAKRFACCRIQLKRKEPNANGIRQGKRDSATYGYPMSTLHARRHYLRTQAPQYPTPLASRALSTPKISITKPDEDTASLPKTPEQLKAEVAARFFASYREAERSPISNPLPTDFSKTTDTFLTQHSEDTSVGAIVGGTLLLDLHHRKGHNDRLSRSSSSRGTRRSRSLSPSGDRIRRCNSTGHYLPRQDRHMEGHWSPTSSMKSRSLDDREFGVELENGGLKGELLEAMKKRMGRLSVSGAESGHGETEAGSDHDDMHLFPEVIVHAVPEDDLSETSPQGGSPVPGRSTPQSMTSRLRQQRVGGDKRPASPGHHARLDPPSPGSLHHSHSDNSLRRLSHDKPQLEGRLGHTRSERNLRLHEGLEGGGAYGVSEELYNKSYDARNMSLPSGRDMFRSPQNREVAILKWRDSKDRITFDAGYLRESGYADHEAEFKQNSESRDRRKRLVHQETVDSYWRHDRHRSARHRLVVPEVEQLRHSRTEGSLRDARSEDDDFRDKYQREKVYDRYQRGSSYDRYQSENVHDRYQGDSIHKYQSEHVHHASDACRHPRHNEHVHSGMHHSHSEQFRERSHSHGKEGYTRERRARFKRNETVHTAPTHHAKQHKSRRSERVVRDPRRWSSLDLLDAEPDDPSARGGARDSVEQCQCSECMSEVPSSHSSRRRHKSGHSCSSHKHISKDKRSREKGARDKRRRGYSQESPNPHRRGRGSPSGPPRLARSCGSLSSRSEHEMLSVRNSESSESESFYKRTTRRERDRDRERERRAASENHVIRHRGIEALGSSASDKDMDMSKKELFMKFFSQEVELDDLGPAEEPRFFLGSNPGSVDSTTYSRDNSLKHTQGRPTGDLYSRENSLKLSPVRPEDRVYEHEDSLKMSQTGGGESVYTREDSALGVTDERTGDVLPLSHNSPEIVRDETNDIYTQDVSVSASAGSDKLNSRSETFHDPIPCDPSLDGSQGLGSQNLDKDMTSDAAGLHLPSNSLHESASEASGLGVTTTTSMDTLRVSQSESMLRTERRPSPSVLTSKCSVIVYDDDLRIITNTRSHSVSNNVSPKRTSASREALSDNETSGGVDGGRSSYTEQEHPSSVTFIPDVDSSGSAESGPTHKHSGPSSLLSVTDTDSAVSSSASRQTTPVSGTMYTSSVSKDQRSRPCESRAVSRVKDSAYQTKESSMDNIVFEPSRETRRRRSSLPSVRSEDRKVTQRLHQAAVKLYILQQRVRKARLSRDSAVNTISEDEAWPESEEISPSGPPSRYAWMSRKQSGTCPEFLLQGQEEKREAKHGGITEEEEHESDLDTARGLYPTPEILPSRGDNFVEDSHDVRECEV